MGGIEAEMGCGRDSDGDGPVCGYGGKWKGRDVVGKGAQRSERPAA